MKNFNIGTRLGAGFAIVLLLLGMLTTVGIMRLVQASAMTEALVKVHVRQEREMAEWLKVIEVNAARTSAAWKVSDAGDQKDFEAAMARSSGRATEIQDSLGLTLTDPALKQQYQSVLSTRKEYTDVRKNVFKAKAAGDMELGKKLYEDTMVAKRELYLEAINKLAKMQHDSLDVMAADIEQKYQSGRVLLLVLGLLAGVCGVTFAVWLTRSVTGPIRYAVRVAHAVSEGDLTSAIEVKGTDEAAQLMQALKKMNESLVVMVGAVRTGTTTMATAATEIAAGNLDLSARTEQQASSLEETASSMEQLTSTVKGNADSARQANQLAIEAAEIASRGGAVVADVVSTMGSINDSSRKIVDIISVIDGIAFQTNILALNAAVEAARAGEQGRGLAVVASEVRNLAQRSASAAKEIKALIDDSVRKVETGSSQVDRAGHTMNEIVQSIGSVTAIMNQISDASEEQRAGIEQVNQAITQMDQVTQQNAALVEQAAAATASLKQQAGGLADVVGVFKLDNLHAVASHSMAQQKADHPAHLQLSKPAPANNATVRRTNSPVRSTAAEAPGGVDSPSARQTAVVSAPSKPTRRTAATPAAGDDWEEF